MKYGVFFTFIFLLCGTALASNTLTVYVYPPRVQLDWSSPNSLLNDLGGIGLGTLIDDHLYLEGKSDFAETYRVPVNYRSTMGHTIAEINCTLPNGKLYRKWSSFSGQNYTELTSDLIFNEQIGFGGMFYDFNDGYIIAGSENLDKLLTYNGDRLRDINGRLKQVKPRYMKAKISKDECGKLKKMVSFFESFHYSKDSTLKELDSRGPLGNLHFTTNIDPYESYKARQSNPEAVVGGGCAPYGVALLKEVGFYDDLIDNDIKLNIPVSKKLMGGITDPHSKVVTKVSISSILFSDLGESWEHEGFESRLFSQYDPQLLWSFIGQVRSCLGDPEFRGEECSKSAKSYLERNSHLSIEAAAPKKISQEIEIKGHFNFQKDQRPLHYDSKVEFEMRGLDLVRKAND